MQLKCFATFVTLCSLADYGVGLSLKHENEALGLELSQTKIEEMFSTLARNTRTYEYELPALGGLYAGRPLGPLVDFDAMLHPEKINADNVAGVCRLARTLGVLDYQRSQLGGGTLAQTESVLSDFDEDQLLVLAQVTSKVVDFIALCQNRL